VDHKEAIEVMQRHLGAFRGSQLAEAIEHAVEILVSLNGSPRLSEQYAAVALRDDWGCLVDGPPPVTYPQSEEVIVTAEPPEVKYEYRGLVCEFHDQHAHRRVRHATGPWECCDCAGVET